MRPLRSLAADLWRLLRAPAHGYLALGLVLMVLYWWLGSPGPKLAGAVRSLDTAIAAVGWAVLLLLAVPLAIMALRREVPAALRAGWGDWRFGLTVTAVVGTVLVLGMGVAVRVPEVLAAYPWPGAWAGASPAHLLAWTALYAAYYVAFEFFFRGFLLRILEGSWGLPAAIWMQAAAATLIHLGKPLTETVLAIPFSLLVAVLAVRGRSLLWPILLHLVLGLATDVWSLHHQGWLFP